MQLSLDARTRADLNLLRRALEQAGYTGEGVTDTLGPSAMAALARHETVPARRACLANRGPAATLIRLFLLQDRLDADTVAGVLPIGVAQRLGLVETSGAVVGALLDVRPYDEGCYVVSDLGTGIDGRVKPVAADHVLGPGGASLSLADLTVRHNVGSALDLGTGAGVQALHLVRHAQRVVATDVLPRALRLAAFGAALSDVEIELRHGPLFDPVAGERFDLIVSNPPFVIGAEPSSRRAYRDSDLPADQLCQALVAAAPAHLNPGGWCQVLANWLHLRGEDWRSRVGGWLPAGVDAWVLQREVLDPAAYVSLWLHDGGDVAATDYSTRYDRWLSGFEDAGVEGIGLGWISLRRSDTDQPHRRLEEWPNPLEHPLGPHVAATFERIDWLRTHREPDQLLSARLRVADRVVQDQHSRPGAEDPDRLILRQEFGLRRFREVDTATAALVGACDGSLPLGALIAAVAEVLGEGTDAVRDRVLPVVRELIADGYLSG